VARPMVKTSNRYSKSCHAAPVKTCVGERLLKTQCTDAERSRCSSSAGCVGLHSYGGGCTQVMCRETRPARGHTVILWETAGTAIYHRGCAQPMEADTAFRVIRRSLPGWGDMVLHATGGINTRNSFIASFRDHPETNLSVRMLSSPSAHEMVLRLAAANLTPEVVHASRHMLAQKWLPGWRPLASVVSRFCGQGHDPSQLRALWPLLEQVGSLTARLHARATPLSTPWPAACLTGEGVAHERDMYQRVLTRFSNTGDCPTPKAIEAAVADSERARKGGGDARCRVVAHNDWHAGNIIAEAAGMDTGRLQAIDFDWLGVGSRKSPAADLAYFTTTLGFIRGSNSASYCIKTPAIRFQARRAVAAGYLLALGRDGRTQQYASGDVLHDFTRTIELHEMMQSRINACSSGDVLSNSQDRRRPPRLPHGEALWWGYMCCFIARYECGFPYNGFNTTCPLPLER
jgi:hypothetical protein